MITTRLGLYGCTRSPYGDFSGKVVGAAEAVVGGVTALTEPVVSADSHVNTITLSNATWAVFGASFNQVRQIILNGVTSAQFEDKGWNKEVRDKESVTSVVRTSDTVVTITWTAAPDYNITVNEVITVTVPDEALDVSTSIVATPTIGVTATAALLRSHFVLFRSTSRSATFLSESFQGATFQSISNATIGIVDTSQPLGFILTEDGGILLQEDDLPIALE